MGLDTMLVVFGKTIPAPQCVENRLEIVRWIDAPAHRLACRRVREAEGLRV
jgi:hypothetical protein